MSNVPMTRPEEALAVHETTYFHSSTFVELEDGRILHAAGTIFTTSDDRGLTWSEPFECHDTEGNAVGGGGTSLVNLSNGGVGLAAMWRPPEGRVPTAKNTCLLFWRSEDGGDVGASGRSDLPGRPDPRLPGCAPPNDLRQDHSSGLHESGTGVRSQRCLASLNG